VGETFTTPSGKTVARTVKGYRPHAAIHRTTQNYTNVFADVQQRRVALKAEIASTTEQLQAATTDAETQKLTGVLVGLNAALAATDKELDQALSLTLVQEAENRNDQDKQARARAEEQQAEFSESLTAYRDTFKLSTEPAHFPDSKP
jgi:paraquat-inducible protein B